ncbi:MAG: lipopolysaccharide transport periplasmic protein LptA [Pseudomonadota bacterium]
MPSLPPRLARLSPAAAAVVVPAVALLAALAGSVHAALTLDRNQPIQIEADSAVIDEPSGSAIYRGHVLLQQGTLKLQSSELTVYIRDGKATKAVAHGRPVLLDQAPTATEEAIHAEARHITFLIEEDRMLLDDQASLKQGDRLFQGAHIDYNVAQRRVNASGGGSSRVLLVLPPTPAKGDATGTPPPKAAEPTP